MKWTHMPGNRDWEAMHDGRRFLVHVGHGELWYGLEYTESGKFYASRGRPWEGPHAQIYARDWCERVAKQPKRQGRVE